MYYQLTFLLTSTVYSIHAIFTEVFSFYFVGCFYCNFTYLFVVFSHFIYILLLRYSLNITLFCTYERILHEYDINRKILTKI